MIHSYVWNELPISWLVLKEIESYASKEVHNTIQNGNILFEWDYGETIVKTDCDEVVFDYPEVEQT